MLASALSASVAHAQWSVVDQDANSKLDDIERKIASTNEQLGSAQEGGDASINKNLDTLNKRFDLDTSNASHSPGMRVEDPKQPWAQLQLEQGAEQCNQIAASQQAFCIELVRTRNAQYMYMKTMYDNTGARNKRLTDLVDARGRLEAHDFGKLEDNTNQILALQTLIALDRQQMESVNHAYQARIDYLNTQITRQASAATSGIPVDGGDLSGAIGSIVGSVVSGVVLKGGLNISRHESAPGQRTLSIEQ